MKRSFINKTINDTIAYLNDRQFYLPKWAYWKKEDWRINKNMCANIFEGKLGWDIFDGGKDFLTTGMVLFTIRNGSRANNVRPYCEKIIVMEEGQYAPFHYHKVKTEDIINRSRNALALKLCGINADGSASKNDVDVLVDGISRKVKIEEELVLQAGESVTLLPHCCHKFYPREGKILIGEVSKVNDDYTDNYFLENIHRFPTVEEDEEMQYPLINDYGNL